MLKRAMFSLLLLFGLVACVPTTPSTPVSTETPLPTSTRATATPFDETPQPSPTHQPIPTKIPTPIPTQATFTPTPETLIIVQPLWHVHTLLVAPGEPGRLYALQQTEIPSETGPWEKRVRLLISDDLGTEWRPFPGGLPPVQDRDCIVNINLDYAQEDALYASTCQGLYRWSGSEWQFLSPQKTGMVAVVYGQPQTVWATAPFPGHNGPVIRRSDDGGQTWMRADYGLIQFNGVANIGIDPRDTNALYAIIWPKYAGSYLRRGTADGQWQEMPIPSGVGVIGVGMTMDGGNGTLYVTVDTPTAQLWRSARPNTAAITDVPWELVHDFGRDASVQLLASGWSPDGLALYANISPLDWQPEGHARVGDEVLHWSPDGGQTWEAFPIPHEMTNGE